MKFFAFLTLATAALASPVSIQETKRQTVGDTANEFVNGGCRDVIFIFSRGSTETGNMVRTTNATTFSSATKARRLLTICV